MTGREPPDPAASPGPRTPPGTVTIRCRENGPLVVEMPLTAAGTPQPLRVTDHEGREFALPTDKRATALCRCGCSGTKPFCDGSHKKLGDWASGPPGEPA
jgi:CDGSH-type Zn-finger protein